jgi:hypothetical protein
MRARLHFVVRAIVAATPALALACSGGSPDEPADAGGTSSASDVAVADALPTQGEAGAESAGLAGDDRLTVPAGLPNTNLDGADEGLILVAFTLVQEASGPVLYAAVRNDLDTPACEAGMTTWFYDKAGALVTSVGSVLQSGRLYRMADGTLITCIDPGQTAMTAATGLPSSMAVEDFGSLQHLFPSFIVSGIVPVPGLSVGDVQTVDVGSGFAYTGTVTNGLDVAVSSPKVSVFPVSRVGRPLGVATGAAGADLPAGGRWTFTTGPVNDVGAGFAVFPSATVAN